MAYVYHGSKVPNITVLEARSTLHQSDQKVVYLTDNIPYALVYIWDSKKNRMKRKHVSCGIKNGLVIYEEQFPDQLKTFYEGVSGYLYAMYLSDEISKVENRENMFYSLEDISVDKVIYIEDVYQELLKYEKEGKFVIRRYNDLDVEGKQRMIDMFVYHINQENLLHRDDEYAKFIQYYFKEAWKCALEGEL